VVVFTHTARSRIENYTHLSKTSQAGQAFVDESGLALSHSLSDLYALIGPTIGQSSQTFFPARSINKARMNRSGDPALSTEPGWSGSLCNQASSLGRRRSEPAGIRAVMVALPMPGFLLRPRILKGSY
jgi:hypothetical protein